MTNYPDLGDWRGRKPASADTGVVEYAELLAWTVFDQLTVGRLAFAPTTIRPVCEGCARETWMKNALRSMQRYEYPYYAMVVNGAIACGVGHRDVLLDVPNGGVLEVRVDGTALDSSAWRVDDGNRLVRQDGKFWPTFQDFNLPDRAVGTFEVDYYRGFRPGELVKGAVSRLAWEFYLAATDKKHQLPSNVTTVARQGVTFTMKDPLFTNGQTGIAEVDIVIRRYNPHGLSAPTVIASVDTLRRRVRG